MTRRWGRAVFAAAAVAAAVTLGAGNALADSSVTITYPVTGSTHLNGPDSTASLGPGSLTATEDIDTGGITASLSLPSTTASFTVLGIPSTATTEFIPVGQTTGSIANGGVLTTTSQVIIRITDLKEAGIDVPVGPACQTIVPASITVSSPPKFRPALGGTLTGTYSIPLFNNCGLLDVLAPVINLIVPGPGNTISLTLGTPSS